MFVNGFFRELHPHPCRRGMRIVDGVGARTSHRTRKTKAGEEATSVLIFLKSSTRPTRKVKSVPELSVMPQLLLLRAGEIQSKVRFNCHKLELKLFCVASECNFDPRSEGECAQTVDRGTCRKQSPLCIEGEGFVLICFHAMQVDLTSSVSGEGQEASLCRAPRQSVRKKVSQFQRLFAVSNINKQIIS